MSFDFHIEGVHDLEINKVIGNTGLTDIAFHEDAAQPKDDFWPLGTSLIFRKGISIRRVQVNYQPGSFQLSVYSMSSDEDFDLAVRIAAAVALISESPITDDDSDKALGSTQFLELRSHDWIKETGDYYFSSAIQHYLSQKKKSGKSHCFQINGVNDRITLGPKTLDPLLSNPKTLREKIYERIRYLNYPEEIDPQVFRPQFITDTVMNLSYMVYSPNNLSLLSDQADFFALSPSLGSKDMKLVQQESLINALSNRIEWVDDSYFLAPPLLNEAYQELFDSLEDASDNIEEQRQNSDQ